MPFWGWGWRCLSRHRRGGKAIVRSSCGKRAIKRARPHCPALAARTRRRGDRMRRWEFMALMALNGVDRRHCCCHSDRRGYPRLHRGIGEPRIDFPVERVDDFRRRVLGCTERQTTRSPRSPARIHPTVGIVRQRRRARCGGDRQGANIAAATKRAGAPVKNTIQCSAFKKMPDGTWDVEGPTTFRIGTFKKTTFTQQSIGPVFFP